MNILGIEKSSFIDYPDKIATVVFTGGCNFRCPYCHNRQLVLGEGEAIDSQELLSFLIKRKKFIDAVCISGGEPTLQGELHGLIRKIKAADFLIKVDTNGTEPQVIRQLLSEGLLDYIAMDVKGPFHQYELLTQTRVDIEKIKASIELIRNAPIEYEFRTTLCKELLSLEDILETARYLKGSKRYFLQNFRDGDTILTGKGKFSPFTREQLEKIKKEISPYFEICGVR